MKVKTLSLLGGAAAMLIAGTASADFLGLSWDLHGTHNVNGTDYNVYRVYADFTDSGIIGYWGGSPGNPFSISTGDGSSFYQAQNQATALPAPAGFFYDFDPVAADNSTFMTIGAVPGYSPGEVGEVFQLAPGFAPVLGAPSFGGEAGVVTNPGGPNSLSIDGRVLLMQLTVEAGAGDGSDYIVLGENITISGQVNGESFQTVTMFQIPAPGALALLGLAGLVGSRRRRA